MNPQCLNLLPMVETTTKHHDFATRLNAVMGEKGLSVKDLSLACGVTYEMARRYTMGIAKPRDEKLLRISEWLGVEPSWLDYGHKDAPISSMGESALPLVSTANDDEDEFGELSSDEKRLLRAFRQYPSTEAENMLLVFEMRLQELKEKYRDYFKSIGGKL